MASPAQILANRENALHSTGPKTADGKRTSSGNAMRHGLTGTQIVLPGEDAAAYQELSQGMVDAYKPATEPERVLVQQIAANSWRLMRAQRVETLFLTKLAEDGADSDDAIATAMLERPKDLARIQRYVTAAQNAYYKAMNELSKLQKARHAAEREAEMNDAFLASQSQQQPIGFVSQHDAEAYEPSANTAYIATAATPAPHYSAS